jgi:hypothetical protein
LYNLFFQPCTTRAFAFRFFNRFCRQIAEREQNFFRFLFLVAGKFRKRDAKTFYPKIIVAFGAFDAIQKGGELDELVARVEEIEIEDFLPCHKSLPQYKTELPPGNGKKTALEMERRERTDF